MTGGRIERVSLGAEGLSYVRTQLEGGRTLSRAVLPRWHEFREAFTLVPAGVDPDSLLDFESGGKLPGGMPERGERIVAVPNTNAALARLIREYLETPGINACILENFVARPDFPYVAGFTRTFFFEQEVYHYVLATDVRDEAVDAAIREASSLVQFVGVLTACPVDARELERASVSRELLENLARDTRVLIAGAYDGESYVIAHT